MHEIVKTEKREKPYDKNREEGQNLKILPHYYICDLSAMDDV